MNRFHRLTVTQIEKLTPSAVKISFQIPENLRKVFEFEAGNYITLQTTIDNQLVRRAYSICSAIDDEQISVAIKRVPNGIFSTYATTQLKVGDQLEVMSPRGSFIFFHDIFGNQDLVLFAAGSGVTPMMSIIKSALRKTKIKVVLVYGNRSIEETMFFDEIESLKKEFSGRLFVEYLFSRHSWSNTMFRHIDVQMVDFVLKKYAHLNLGRYYTCGPEQMVNDIKEYLLQIGISPYKIFTELFTVSQQQAEPISLEGKVKIHAVIGQHILDFESDKNQSLLDAIINNGGNAPYSCQGGVCSSCMARISGGTAQMIKNETLTEKEVAAGLILTCQAFATSDEITVDFNDI